MEIEEENLEEKKLELSKPTIEKTIPKYLSYIASYYEWSALGIAILIIILLAGVDFIINTINSFYQVPYSKAFIYMILGLVFIASIIVYAIARFLRNGKLWAKNAIIILTVFFTFLPVYFTSFYLKENLDPFTLLGVFFNILVIFYLLFSKDVKEFCVK